MYFQRTVDQYLLEWVDESDRKPLLLRGARQVGKTSAVKNIANKFSHFVEINFDESDIYKEVFQKGMDIGQICEELAIITKKPIVPGKTLLFLDEIQACPEAIRQLRYFYEKLPDLHVIAAGSLLEFALADFPSFGVGRVRSLFMHPMSFQEFLLALEENLVLDHLSNISAFNPISEVIHAKLLQLYKKFLIVGGMPEAVSALARGKSLLQVQQILNDLVLSIQADFVKYSVRTPIYRFTEVFQALVQQTGKKFTYSYDSSTLNHKQIREVIGLFIKAGLIYPVHHSAANGIPLGAEINIKKVKYLIFDTGIFQRLLGLDLGALLLGDDFTVVNKGNIAELAVGLELMKADSLYHQHQLFYWHREAKNSQAEVDYLEQFNERIIPIEVKSASKGSMQSLHLFLEEKHHPYGLRLSLENFGQVEKIKIMPVYAAFLMKNLINSDFPPSSIHQSKD